MLLEFQIATVLQGLIVIFAEDYEPSTWRTILLAWVSKLDRCILFATLTITFSNQACLLVSACLAANRFGRSPWLWKGVCERPSAIAVCTRAVGNEEESQAFSKADS